MEEPAVVPRRVADAEGCVCYGLILPRIPRRLIDPFLVIPVAFCNGFLSMISPR